MYKVVPAPVVVDTKGGGAGATALFQDLLNREAAGGWRFVSMEAITTTTTTGCLMWKQRINTEHNMLVFVKM